MMRLLGPNADSPFSRLNRAASGRSDASCHMGSRRRHSIGPSSAIGGGASLRQTSDLRPAAGISFSISTGRTRWRGSINPASGMAMRGKPSPLRPRRVGTYSSQAPRMCPPAPPGSLPASMFGAAEATLSRRHRCILPGVIYSIRRDLPIAEAPKWLVEAAMPPAVPAFAQLRHRVNLDSIQGIPGIVRVIAKASIGERNAIVFWAACRLGEMVAARRIARSLAVDDQTTISTVAEFVSRLAEHQEFSENSLALEFAAKHSAHLRYVAPWGKWLFWARSYWEIEPTLAVFDMARKICREAARRCNKPSEGKILSKAKTVAAVETLAKADRRIAATTTRWKRSVALKHGGQSA